MADAALNGGHISVGQIATDAFGNALGQALGDDYSASHQQNPLAARTRNQIGVGNQGDAVLYGPLGGSGQWGPPSTNTASMSTLFGVTPQDSAPSMATLYGVTPQFSYTGSSGSATPAYNDQSVTVSRGDTVEALARANYGDNWRAGVAAIVGANGLQPNMLGSPMLSVGRDVAIPDLQRYVDQGISLDALAGAGGGIIAGNQHNIDSYNSWQMQQAQASTQAAMASAGGAAGNLSEGDINYIYGLMTQPSTGAVAPATNYVSPTFQAAPWAEVTSSQTDVRGGFDSLGNSTANVAEFNPGDFHPKDAITGLVTDLSVWGVHRGGVVGNLALYSGALFGGVADGLLPNTPGQALFSIGAGAVGGPLLGKAITGLEGLAAASPLTSWLAQDVSTVAGRVGTSLGRLPTI